MKIASNSPELTEYWPNFIVMFSSVAVFLQECLFRGAVSKLSRVNQFINGCRLLVAPHGCC
jgi:hypothetical protein